MAVRIRMKMLGRKNRPFYRVCAFDSRTGRNGKVIEELGYYDPMIGETDARAVLNRERVAHWLKVGALPSEKVAVLIKKYGENGTHVQQQATALERLKLSKPKAPAPVKIELKKPEVPAAEAPATEATDAPPAEAASE